MEETTKKNHPSLPPNYVSLADLQQRWLKQQQQQQREKEKEKKKEKEKHKSEEPQQRQQKRRENEKPKTHKPNNLRWPAQIGDGDDVKKGREKEKEKEKLDTQQQQEKGREKEQCEPQNPNFAPRDQFGREDEKPESITNSNPNFPNRRSFGRNCGDGKGRKEYRLVKSNAESKPVKIEPEIDGGDRVLNNLVDGEEKGKVELKKKKKNKYKKKKKTRNPVPEGQNPASNGEYGGKEREIEVKGGGEAPLKLAMGDRRVEIEEKLKKLSADGQGWRSNGRSMAVIEGPPPQWSDRGYGRVEHRGMWRTRPRPGPGVTGKVFFARDTGLRREDGFKWVKKGEVAEMK